MIVGIVTTMVVGVGKTKADFTFGEPVNLGSTVNSVAFDGVPCNSADGLELYFGSYRDGGYGGADIWVCNRETTEEEWGSAMNLGPELNSPHADWQAAISTDGLELYFQVWELDASGSTYISGEIWLTRRIAKGEPWGQPEKLDLTVPGGNLLGGPSLTADGLELHFFVAQLGDGPKAELYVTKRTTVEEPWGEPVRLSSVVNDGVCQVDARISSDGLLLISNDWWACSPRMGGMGNRDIWIIQRAAKDEDWTAPINPGPPVNSSFIEHGVTISADGSTLYFGSSRPGGSGYVDLWQAPILPVMDFDGDGNVALSDLMLMVDSWGTNNARCDIGPMPWGDGVVDEADLDVLMASWDQAVDFPYDPGKASNPKPTEGSTIDVDEISSLSWTAGRNIAKHDVYLGTDSAAVEEADISDISGIYRGQQDASEYTPPIELEFGKTFFWRIDEVNTDGNVIKGKLWSFIVADVVDNFEDYNDDTDAGTTIWQTWWDGFGVPANGSLVGYVYAPFAEQTIVHGGLQSMPFYYDNSLALSSEATRLWGEPQDWTRRDVKRLTLWIHGQSDNDPESPYVALRDNSGNSAIVMENDPVVTTVEEWQQWSIDLTAFTGVNPDSITEMTFGVGDKTDTQPGGTGTIFVDDIELHLP